jgi:hypothetical protein
MISLRTFVLALLLVAPACAARPRVIGNSKIADTSFNRGVIDVVETYRTAMERQDTKALLLLASKAYWEDSGTPSGGDDYGFDGLQSVLSRRLGKVRDVRYSMRYVTMKSNCGSSRPRGCRAAVEVLVDASYTIVDALGNERRPDKRDQGEFVLEWSGEKWQFLSGM